MKKNSFIQGAFIATLGIVLCKILGVLYVIPFYAIIGSTGGALYGYAYNIYSIFLSISQAGIPLAISKVTSEYHTLGYDHLKERAFKLGKKTLLCFGVICFLVLFITAPFIAQAIIGNVEGGNSVGDVTFVLRMVSTAILVVPILSVYRGYLQGHKYITPTSISQILEQLLRVLVIVIGSFLTLKVFHLSLKDAVGVAVFAATIGALASYFYLVSVVHRNKNVLASKGEVKKEEKVSDKTILKKIIIYALPFILIDIFKSLYSTIDIMTLVKTLVNNLGYSVTMAESIMSVFSTWGLKLNMIVVSLTTGVMVSLIPNLSASLVQKDYDDVRNKITKTLQMLFFLAVPMVFGLSFLADPIWTLFYGKEASILYGTVSYQYYVFTALAMTLFTSCMTILQTLKAYKVVGISLISGFLTKLLFNVPLLYAFTKMGLPSYYGSITASILGYLVPSFIALFYFNKKLKVRYEETLKRILTIFECTFVMLLVLFVLRQVVPLSYDSRLGSLFVILLYALVGSVTYFLLMRYNKLTESIFGNDLKKMKIKRKG